ncbi:MAG: class I SAM-dependent methyltransferase, partial [Armatimonadota bacterium]
MAEETREPQYQRCVELRDTEGLASLGLMSNQTWHDDPKRLVFMLARYKFVAKMMAGQGHVLEVGCADAFGTRIVQQEVGKLTAVDFDPVFVADAQSRLDPHWPFECFVHDLTAGPVPGQFEAAYSLDVLEHIAPEQDELFLANLVASLAPHGTLIIGTPSAQSQVHASPASREGHVNCKDAPALRELLGRFFHNVFIFSMNDEVVHTGFTPMANYLLALCC